MASGPGFVPGAVDVVWLGGDDRWPFLDRASTGRLADVPLGSGAATVVTTDEGRVVDLVVAYRGPAGTALLASARGAGGPLAAHLARYVLYGDDVRVTDASSQVAVTRLFGPGADEVVARLVPSAASPVGARGPHGTWIEAELEAAPLWLMGHDPLCGLGGIDLVAPVGAPESALANRLEALGAEPWTRSHLEAARVEAGLPAFPREIDGRANPLELGLRAVVDFAKGCYIGQEVVARLDAYGKVRRTLVVIESDGPIAEGDALEPSEAVSAVPGSRQPAPVGSGSPVTVRTVAEPPAAASSAAGPAPHAPSARRALALVPAAWATASGLVARSDRASMPVRIVAVAATLRTAGGLLDSPPERPV